MAFHSHSKYTILRESACGERLFYLFHRLGIQSNVVVSARYTNDSHLLTRSRVIAALRVVVQAHPMMRVVGIMQASSKKRNKHTLHLAMLHRIDLGSCVEFMDDPDALGVTPSVIEKAHNEWEHTADVPDKPLFKLIVVGQRDVVLVYHHMMADGMSGYVFHREFLRALNDIAASSPGSPQPSEIIYSSSKVVDLPFEWSLLANEDKSKDRRWHPSILELIWGQSAFFVSQLFFSSRFIFSKLPSSQRYLRSVTGVADESQRTVTSVVSSRIAAPQVSKILAACRKNGTTFTPLLITMLLVVLSTDYNKDASIGSTRFALDMRPHLPTSVSKQAVGAGNGVMFNCTSGMARASRLKKYRELIKEISGSTISIEKAIYGVNDEKLWELTRKYKQWMTEQTDPAIRAVRSSRDMKTDLENVLNRIMPFAGTVLTSTVLVSNLGVFTAGKSYLTEAAEASVAKWDISDVQFSAAASNGALGSQGPIFNVSGLKGGDTIINSVFEEGIMTRNEVQKILDTTVARLVALG